MSLVSRGSRLCNATMYLHTGDLVRVNGGQGTVELLEEQEQIVMRVRYQN